MQKWVFIFILSILSFLSFKGEADEGSCEVDNITCFECGPTCRAKFTSVEDENGDSIGTFTISGIGGMNGYGWHEEPDINGDFYSRPYAVVADQVKNIKIEEGITSVGYNAFIGFSSLENVELPNSVNSIAAGGFQNCISLKNINIPENVSHIGGQAFENTALTSFIVPNNASISQNAFYLVVGKTPLQEIYCNKANLEACQNAVAYLGDDVEVVKYEKISDHKYLMKGRYYSNLNDIGTIHYDIKRIYTIDEANAVAGDKNRVSITYK